MGSHQHHPVEIDPANLKQAENVWSGFVTMTKYGIIAIVIILLGMGFFLL